MKRFIEGQDRLQRTLFPESHDDFIAEGNPVHVIDVFVDGLDFGKQGFEAVLQMPRCSRRKISDFTRPRSVVGSDCRVESERLQIM